MSPTSYRAAPPRIPSLAMPSPWVKFGNKPFLSVLYTAPRLGYCPLPAPTPPFRSLMSAGPFFRSEMWLSKDIGAIRVIPALGASPHVATLHRSLGHHCRGAPRGRHLSRNSRQDQG